MTPAQFLERFKVSCFFHFTDVRNLPSIRARGGLLPWSDRSELAEEIVAPGGNQLSHDLDEHNGLHRYVHLCLFQEHPMEWRAREDHRIESSRFLRIHPSVIEANGVLFTPGVANKTGMPTFTLAEAVHELDFEVAFDHTDWRDPEIQRRLKLAKKYEVLVPGLIPLNLIKGL